MKKTSIIFAILIMSIKVSYTQSFSGFTNFGSASSNIVVDGVKQGLNIIKQEYVLSDTTAVDPRKYGYNNNDYFGRKYNLGVIVDGRLITNKSILNPWVDDVNFDDYKDDQTVRPELSKRYYRTIDTTEYLRLRNRELLYEQQDSLCVIADSLKGFTSNLIDSGKIDGWIVAVSGDYSQIDSLTDFKIEAYKSSVEISQGQICEVNKIDINNDFIGGVYITPTSTQVGIVELKVVGLVAALSEKWYLLPINQAVAIEAIKLTEIGEGEIIEQETKGSESKKQSKWRK